MKNQNLNLTENEQTIKDLSYKEVVIIGNGPSGISLSFFLAGNFPYWTEDVTSHPDELLRARLAFADENKSLIDHDLHQLAQGLEGRTTNPVSLLFDNLQHPAADLGLKLPCMLKYKYHKDKEVDHVVLGKGLPGGSWHRMDPNLRTLSLSTWMSLPNLNFDDYLTAQRSLHLIDDKDDDKSCQCNQKKKKNLKDAHLNSSSHNLTTEGKHQSMTKSTISNEVKTRALVQDVAKYYADYVRLMNLDKFFRNDTVVVSIRQIKENEKCKFSTALNARYIVNGFDRVTKKPFLIACNKVVLANGGSDLVNRLGVKGESKCLSWLKYELPSLESAIEDEKLNALTRESKAKPVLIVGAGLSAADAIVACQNAGLKVIHVFRGVAAGFMGLPEAYFPEYNMVYRLMRNPKEKYDLYQAIPESTLKEIRTVNGCHYVTVQKSNNEDLTFEVSYCAILIGSRPNLSFISNLPKDHHNNSNNTSNNNQRLTNIVNIEAQSENFAIRSLRRLKIFCDKCRHLNLCFGNRNRNNLLNSFIENAPQQKYCECDEYAAMSPVSVRKLKVDDSGIGFGENPKKPVDCKNNPIAVNKFTNELLDHKGIFAMGPLVGDNFVRFISGGALSIASHIFSEKNHC
ncbi:hypothetical protein PVAND_002435 [Polypedilum vanderplanki]|uniref:Uncharacterized protein n=1 Tax=Polypedilum vanderplanki TaxID=319348 RepID=A0A9J6BRC4_POLVA|nr:hypothetical protein PVAND_002435 [Polypedilum vanderplanki]